MRLLPLQSELQCYVSTGDRLSCVFDDWAAATGGEAVFGLLLGSVLMVALYQGTDSLAVPAIVLILFGGFLVPLLPGSLVGLSGSIVILGLAAGIFAMLKHYSLQGVR